MSSRCFSPLPGISVGRRTFEGPPFTARRGLRQRFRHILNFYIHTIEFVLLNPLLLSKGDYAWLVFAVASLSMHCRPAMLILSFLMNVHRVC